MLQESGITEPKEIQQKIVSRIIGGHSLFAIGPEKCGKTSSLIWGVISKLKFAKEEAPRALILVPDKERGLQLIEQFTFYGKQSNLRFIGLFSGAGIDGQKEALLLGTDVVIGTPDRIALIYTKSGLNLNKLTVFAMDDTDLIVQQGFHATVHQITESLPKCQHVILTSVSNKKVNRLLELFMNEAPTIEVTEFAEEKINIIDATLFHAVNFKTKINLLLNHIVETEKVVIFANTLLTSKNIFQEIQKHYPGEICILSANKIEEKRIETLNDFIENEDLKILVVSIDQYYTGNFDQISILIFFDIPTEKDFLIEKISVTPESLEEKMAILYVIESEIGTIKKIEQFIGESFPVEETPEDCIKEVDRSIAKDLNKKEKNNEEMSSFGGAFHEKKESNAKEYNYKFKDRLKMFGKKNRRGKKLS